MDRRMSTPAIYSSPDEVEQAFYEAVGSGDADQLMLVKVR